MGFNLKKGMLLITKEASTAIEKIVISYTLNKLLTKIIRKHVSPHKSIEILHLQFKDLKLKIESDRKVPGFQKIDIYLDNSSKASLSSTTCRRSTKKLYTTLNKKVENQFKSIVIALDPEDSSDKDNSFSQFQKRIIFKSNQPN
ncbi:hypothetical protein [Priestia aryabhattai]